MPDPIKKYWELRLERVKTVLERNHFEAHRVADVAEAQHLALEELIPATNCRTLSWGGSATFVATGLYQQLVQNGRYEVIDTYAKDLTAEQVIERRRQALLVDLFITGTNAVTENGQLVNLDMIGNRVAALTFGPKQVLILVGRNKVVADLDAAMQRIKAYAAPANVMRLDKQTPCARTAVCQECNSPDRICNHWTITEKSFPPKRIKVVLINADLGL